MVAQRHERETYGVARAQNCIMLKQAAGFTAQTSTNKLFQTPYAVARSEDGQRWIITGWDPCDRCWGNEQFPCIHADPKFPDCPPGETVRLRGCLSFYEGKLIERNSNASKPPVGASKAWLPFRDHRSYSSGSCMGFSPVVKPKRNFAPKRMF